MKRITLFTRKTADDTIKEQFTETSSLSTILKWYEKHVYRHLYVPLCPREEDSTVKCVSVVKNSSMYIMTVLKSSLIAMPFKWLLSYSIIVKSMIKINFIYQHQQIFFL